MPNWVSNRISIHGQTEQLQEVYAEWCKPRPDGVGFSFQNLIPRPETEEGNWYNWNINNWGTKWDACHGYDEWATDYLALAFDTAWSPPEPIFEAMADVCRKHGFGLTISFEEEQGWGGEWELEEDGTWNMTEWDIPESHEDYTSRDKMCPCELWPEDEWFHDCPKKEVAV